MDAGLKSYVSERMFERMFETSVERYGLERLFSFRF